MKKAKSRTLKISVFTAVFLNNSDDKTIIVECVGHSTKGLSAIFFFGVFACSEPSLVSALNYSLTARSVIIHCRCFATADSTATSPRKQNFVPEGNSLSLLRLIPSFSITERRCNKMPKKTEQKMVLSPVKMEQLSKQPIIENTIIKSEDGKWIIHRTTITDIKPVTYFEKVLAK